MYVHEFSCLVVISTLLGFPNSVSARRVYLNFVDTIETPANSVLDLKAFVHHT